MNEQRGQMHNTEDVASPRCLDPHKLPIFLHYDVPGVPGSARTHVADVEAQTRSHELEQRDYLDEFNQVRFKQRLERISFEFALLDKAACYDNKGIHAGAEEHKHEDPFVVLERPIFFCFRRGSVSLVASHEHHDLKNFVEA